MAALHEAVDAARELHNIKRSVTRQNVASLEKKVDEIEDRFQQEQKLRREAEHTVQNLEQELAQAHVKEQQRLARESSSSQAKLDMLWQTRRLQKQRLLRAVSLPLTLCHS